MGKKHKKIDIPSDQMKKCNAIIHSASTAAGTAGAGLAQIPMADSALITPIQIGMIVALGKVFNQKISKTAAQAIISGASASLIGRGLSQILVGWVPVVGNVVNTATAAGITEAIGWIAVDNFSKNQYIDIINANPEDDSDSEDDVKDSVVDEDEYLQDLKNRMRAFINNEKDKKGADREEYNALFNEVEKIIDDVDDEELKQLYDEL